MMKNFFLGVLYLLTAIVINAQTPFGCTNTLYNSMVNSSTSSSIKTAGMLHLMFLLFTGDILKTNVSCFSNHWISNIIHFKPSKNSNFICSI